MSKDAIYHPEWDKKLLGQTAEAKELRKADRPMRASVLDEAKSCVCTDRNSQYGEPEDNFAVIAELWTQYLTRSCGALMRPLTGYDVSMLMTLFKIGRMETGVHKLDSFVDAIGYLACAAELALGLALRGKGDAGNA